MHLGNGAITPECGVVALGVAAAGAGVAFVAARAAGMDRGRARTASALGAAVFAAQLFNVQILPFSSVHLIGGVLLAWVLGPALGALTMTAILALQAVLLGDGGLLALGANVINMGLVPAGVVALVRHRQSARCAADQQGVRAAGALALAAFAATVGGAALIVLEVALGRDAAQLEGLGAFASQMLWWHALAGLLEAGASVAIVAALRAFGEMQATGLQLSARSAAAVAGMSLLIAAFSVPSLGLASAAPDGYQAALAAAQQSGFALGQIEVNGQSTGIAAIVQGWQAGLVSALPGREAVLVVLAALLAGVMSWSCASWCFSRLGRKGRWQVVR